LKLIRRFLEAEMTQDGVVSWAAHPIGRPDATTCRSPFDRTA
jgi:hypothetical protein